jgi:methyl-accepting chemotaxis protein
MPLWSRIALSALLLVLAAVGITSTLQAFAARRAILEQARAGAHGVAEVLAKATAFAEEVPPAVEAEIGEQMLTQARLLAQLVAVAEGAGVPREDLLARLRGIAGPGQTEFLATDDGGVAIYETDPAGEGFRFTPDASTQPQAHVFHRLLAGETPSVIQESRRRELDGRVFKYVGVPGVDGSRIIQVGMPATFLERLDTAIGLRRLVGEVVVGDVREVRILDARSSPLVTRIVDANGNPSESAPPLDQDDARIVRESIASGRPAGREEGAMVRVAAPVLRADGATGGAVLVGLATRAGGELWRWELLAGLLSSLLIGLPALLVGRWLARSTTESVRMSTAVAESIAAGDLSGTVPPGGKDEAGRLLDGVGRMSAALRETVSRIQAAGTRVTEVESDVSVALARQERIVRGFSGSVADVSGAARVADDGRHGLERMSESMRQLDEVMNAFTRKLATIRQRAGGINAVVTTIAKVADQTNLLSVNATIEAEKAGEAGRGFRIVAQEIRRLADQTALATKDIERMVRDMQSAVASGTMEMDRFRNEVSTRIQQVTEVSRQLAGIVAPVQSVTQALDQVHDGMENQNSGARQVRDSLDRLRAGAGQSASAIEAFVTGMNQLRASVTVLNDELTKLRIDPSASPG